MKKDIEALLASNSLFVETKESKNELPRSIWESYSAFANTFGGDIILGISEQFDNSFKVTGVEKSDAIIKTFWDTVNNPTKVSAVLPKVDDVYEDKIDGKSIVVIHVPRADRSFKPVYINNNPNTGTFMRKHEGDYRCTKDEISSMFRDADNISQDKTILTGISTEVLNKSTIKGYRERLRVRDVTHPWLSLEMDEFLRVLGAAEKNSDGNYEVTRAGLLMFGNEIDITNVTQSYMLDFRLIHNNETRWADRLESQSGTWSGNIFDFFMEVSRRIHLQLEHPFELDGMRRVDDTVIEKSIRELLLNSLIHADYFGRGGVVIEMDRNRISFSNPGLFRVPVERAESGRLSDPRNYTLSKMFSLIGFVERAGSGLYSVLETWKSLPCSEPRIIEDIDPARTTVMLYFPSVSVNIDKKSKEIIRMIEEDSEITIGEMSKEINVSKREIDRMISELKIKQILIRVGGPRNGKWIIKR